MNISKNMLRLTAYVSPETYSKIKILKQLEKKTVGDIINERFDTVDTKKKLQNENSAS